MLGRIRRRVVDNNSGSVLVLTVIFSMATIALGAAYLNYVDHQRRFLADQIASYESSISAYSIMAKGMLEHPQPGVYHSPRTLYYDDGCIRVEVEYYTRNSAGNYNNGYSSSSQFIIYGVAYVTDCELGYEIADTVWHDMSSHSYADWLYITDKETQSYRPHEQGEDTLRFWGPDTLDGKVHSNDMIHFQQGDGFWPVFYGEVSSCSTRFSPPYVINPGYVHFYGGYKLSAPYLAFPLQADSVRAYSDPPPYPAAGFVGVSPGAQADSITEIMLDEDGYIIRHRVQNSAMGARRRQNYDPESLYREGKLIDQQKRPYPASQALFIDGELWISAPKGRHFNCTHPNETNFIGRGFQGVLTIGASGDIIIPQDLLYKSCNADGSVPVSSTDILGLISEKHILVWRNAPQTTRISAGLGAIGDQPTPDVIASSVCNNNVVPTDGMYGTISVDGINCYGENAAKTQLTIWGCLIQKERGLIHTTWSGGERGFDSKDYHYDTRFIVTPPPHFFQTRQFGNYYSEKIFGLDFYDIGGE